MRALDVIVLVAAGLFTIKYVIPLFMDAASYAAKTDPVLDTMAVRSPSKSTGAAGASGPGWDCITHKERLKVVKDPATITGVVLAGGDGGPHYAPDGDLVFTLKPDPQYASMVNDVNIKSKKYAGGIWCEGVCQKANKAKEPRHQGDCASGCGAPKLTAPKVGDHLRITGAHIIDVGEDSHTEIHPIYTMEKI